MDPAPLRYEPGVLHLLDQTVLPAAELWLELTSAEAVAEAIASLRVRGAPAIGVAAAYGIAVVSERSAGDPGLVRAAGELIGSARPTAVNLSWAVDRVMSAFEGALAADADAVGAVRSSAREIHEFEVAACRSMGEHGAGLLGPGARVLTYCNTGALATCGIGTAFGVIRTAYERGRLSTAWVCETRPLLQGARLTAWEAVRVGLPHTVVADGAAGSLFARGLVDAVAVGADRIARNGDTANKIGTYTIATLAARHGVPFYVVAPTSTVDAGIEQGASIPIEERPPDEVRSFGAAFTTPEESPVHNPAFDVTPAELITAIVTEAGVHRAPYDFRDARALLSRR